MAVEIITIGDEVCRGDIVDSNKSRIADNLTKLGLLVQWHTSCRDVTEDIRQAIEIATARAQVVICTGGLGPTTDDITVDVLCEVLGSEWKYDPQAKAILEKRYEAIGREPTELTLRQVRIPAVAAPIANPVGMAPGSQMTIGNAQVFSLPGVPRELEAMLPEVGDKLKGSFELSAIPEITYRTFGATESGMAKRLSSIEKSNPNLSFHYRASIPEISLRIAGEQVALDNVDAEIREAIGKYIITTDQRPMGQVLGEILAGEKVAVAESCTAGLLGALFTKAGGSSKYFEGGVIAYSNQVKIQQLSVSEKTLEQFGAVSEACVKEMAQGVSERFNTPWGLSISGIAGPSGGTEEKPVGTVWIACYGNGEVTTQKIFYPRSREKIRLVACYSAMALLMRRLKSR